MGRKRIKDEKILAIFRGQKCSIEFCCDQSDPCHIKSRGAGGPDTEWNLLPLCRLHHVEQHKIGWLRFIQKYPEIAGILASKGWAVGFKSGKLRHFPEVMEKQINADSAQEFFDYISNG